MFKGNSSLFVQAEEAFQGKLEPAALDMSQGVLGGEICKNVFFMKSFANVTGIVTDEGVVLIDTGSAFYASDLHLTLRSYTKKLVTRAIYTHRHVDHVGGVYIFDLENKKNNQKEVIVYGHTNISIGFDRYKLTNGYNAKINQKQFGTPKPSFNSTFHYPNVTYEDKMNFKINNLNFELYHAKGETDDATWVYFESESKERIVFAGDFLIWAFPNCGNPQKVQRYPIEWANALRKMEEKKPTILIPGHGPPVFGEKNSSEMLLNTALALEDLFTRTIALINEGKTLNYIIHAIKSPDKFKVLPYLTHVYDEPQFIVNNLWRLYAGWYDQNPSHLKPPKEEELSKEICDLCNCGKLVQRAEELLHNKKYEVASSLIEFAYNAHPDDVDIKNKRANIYKERSKVESSLMAKNIFKSVHRDNHGPDEDDMKLILFFADKMKNNQHYIQSSL